MLLIQNRRARFEYELGDSYVAGVVLEGHEVKSLRLKHGSLVGSFVRVTDGEAFLINAQISPYSFANNPDHDPRRTRKLLLSKQEIRDIAQSVLIKNQTLVPLAFLLEHNKIKLKFALAVGRKKGDKRKYLRERAEKRDREAEIS
ncbi:MAG: SsrA-binding protein [Candidatus Pacebacteria bacterium CG10_big_fil_rev_8_21_14_0_10_42_12]|nr:SsrA-binding protein SmpB [Candidatus Paceibacterota bacterium]PIR62602.1 MAG: SsrA-binding protein [Candidatus Pacebacteria bacterium CG10_big_fil_rev_8_21_14_0_10_42_12]